MALTYENGNWGTWAGAPTKLDDAIKRFKLEERKKLECALGPCTIYARTTGVTPYGFMCRLKVSMTVYYNVWMRDLPDLFQFLKEIGAHEPQERINFNQGISTLISFLKDETYFSEAMNELYTWLRQQNKEE
jgi:hypothetical protein